MIYRVTRTDGCTSYDVFEGVVVRAKSVEDALDVAWEHCEPPSAGYGTNYWPEDRANILVEEVSPDGESEVILEDFLRG